MAKILPKKERSSEPFLFEDANDEVYHADEEDACVEPEECRVRVRVNRGCCVLCCLVNT